MSTVSKSWETVSNRERSHPVDQTPQFLFFRLWLVVHTMDEARNFSTGVLKFTGYRLLALKYRVKWLNSQARARKQ